jgi:hypothetical protein
MKVAPGLWCLLALALDIETPLPSMSLSTLTAGSAPMDKERKEMKEEELINE